MNCPVCHDNFFDAVIITTCGHGFCRQCLHEWLKHDSQHRCPECRGFCKLRKIINMYIDYPTREPRENEPLLNWPPPPQEPVRAPNSSSSSSDQDMDVDFVPTQGRGRGRGRGRPPLNRPASQPSRGPGRPRLNRPVQTRTQTRTRGRPRRLNVNTPIDQRPSSSRASITSAIGQLQFNDSPSDNEVFEDANSNSARSQSPSSESDLVTQTIPEVRRGAVRLPNSQLLPPTQTRNWSIVPELLYSQRNKVLRVYENCRFRQKYLRYDNTIAQQVMVWCCNEHSECEAIIATEINTPYKLIGSPNLFEKHIQKHTIPSDEELIKHHFRNNVKVG